MYFIGIVFIAIAANLDNLGVGMAYGIQNIKISHTANSIIAATSFVVTWLSAQIGNILSSYLSPLLTNAIGAILISSIGMWLVAQPVIAVFKRKQITFNLQLFGAKIVIGPSEILRHPESVDIDISKDISWWEAVLLGLALSINALAGGFDAGLTHLSPLLLSILTGIFSFATIIVGHYIGRKYISHQLGYYATAISGILLILIGIHQLIGVS